MLYRILAGIVPMTVGWGIYSGAIPLSSLLLAGGSAREVAAPPAAVDGAVSDLTLEEFTGSLMATRPSGSGARWLKPGRAADGRSWTLMEGDKEVLVLTAHMTPEKDGTATEVTAEAAKGKDYDIDTLPAGLRDMNLVRTVFNAALDMELNALAPPDQRLPRVKLEERRLATVTNAMAATVMANPMALAVDARRQQLSIQGSLDEAERASAEMEAEQRSQPTGVSFAPGQPMVRPNPVTHSH